MLIKKNKIFIIKLSIMLFLNKRNLKQKYIYLFFFIFFSPLPSGKVRQSQGPSGKVRQSQGAVP